jgi:hypothetical protein
MRWRVRYRLMASLFSLRLFNFFPTLHPFQMQERLKQILTRSIKWRVRYRLMASAGFREVTIAARALCAVGGKGEGGGKGVHQTEGGGEREDKKTLLYSSPYVLLTRTQA